MVEDKVAFRLKVFIDAEGLTNSQFADTCGIPRPSLSQLLSGRNKKISDVLVGQIHQAYPNLSILWLLFGEGKMMVDTGSSIAKESPNIGQKDSSPQETPNLFTENREISGENTKKELQQNLSAFTKSIDNYQNVINQQVEYGTKNAELERQLEKLKKNPRKVIQITVYYDDSTFETFYPRKL